MEENELGTADLDEATARLRAGRFWLGLGEPPGAGLDLLIEQTVGLARMRRLLAIEPRVEPSAAPQPVDELRRAAAGLWDGPDRPSVVQVASRLGVGSSSVYRYLRDAKRQGLVTRPLRGYARADS